MKTIITIFVTVLGCVGHYISYAQSWSITGNSGTVAGINYVGTSDAKPLEFRVNNIKSGYISYSDAPGNVGLGYGVMSSVTTGTKNSAFGHKALYSITSGLGNSAVGYKALYANKSGSYNSSFGAQSLAANTGSYNTAAGYAALFKNTTGYQNTAVGYKALGNNSTAGDNTALGSQALDNNTTGYSNTAAGSSSMLLNTTGHDNTAVGYLALQDNTDGDFNTAIGMGSLYYCTHGNNNTALGSLADMNGDYSNATAIGVQATATGSNTVMIGASYITSIGGYADWSNFSDGRYKKNIKEDVKGLAFIEQLRPVTYTLDLTAIARVLNEDRILPTGDNLGKSVNSSIKARSEKEKIIYTGFVAQEVEAAAKKIGYNFSGVDVPAHDKAFYGLRYAEFVVPLVKAVQELSVSRDSIQQKYNDMIKENETLKADNEIRNERLHKMEVLVNQLLLKQPSSFNAKQNAAATSLKPRLDQNKPNPFSGKSYMNYYVPQSSSSALLLIQSLNGQSVKSFTLNKGEGSIELSGNELSAGSYNCVMILDNRIAASKKIIITK